MLQNQQVSEEQLMATLEDPSFSVVLQKSILSAAQTDNQNTHDLLARLVSERIQSPPESLLSMASKIACDVVSSITPNQLMMLDLLANIMWLKPATKLDSSEVSSWLHPRMSIASQVNIIYLDYMHLESLSCIKFMELSTRKLPIILQQKLDDTRNVERFLLTALGQKLNRVWSEDQLEKCTLTTIGQLLGVMTADQRLGIRTTFLGRWK